MHNLHKRLCNRRQGAVAVLRHQHMAGELRRFDRDGRNRRPAGQRF
jgi:hypothetical protein